MNVVYPILNCPCPVDFLLWDVMATNLVALQCPALAHFSTHYSTQQQLALHAT